MKFLLVILLSYISLAHASLPELFGASAGSIAIGNQAQKQSAANNYYAASLLGYSKSTQFSFDFFYVDTDFKNIHNVVTKNTTNTVNTNETGNFQVNPKPSMLMAIHFSTPLFAPEGPKFNFSLFAPVDRVMEADTGDPYAPQYVMYANRFSRPTINFNLAQSFDDWSFSAGVHTGIQTNGEAFFVTHTTSGTYSLGKLSYNAKPSVGALLSVAKKTKNQMSYLNFQQEMKSNFKSRAISETEIASGAAFQFDLDLTSLLFYDPMTIRLGHQIDLGDSQMYFSLDYQQWESFESSNLKITKNAGAVNSSKNFETLKLRNIFIPKIGYETKIHEKWKAKFGYFYRQSPLNTHNLKNAGNTIDVDKHVGSVGLAHLFSIYGKDLTLDFTYQAHLLRQNKIEKTPNQEDGQTAGSKIGSPGYTVGGMIHVLSLGLSWMY
jgi:hypothetical protein